MPLPEAVREIAQRLIAAGYDTWCVGGAVRDWQMGIEDNDVDLATAATPDQVQALFRRTVAVGVKYGTVGVLDPSGGLHEVTTFRKDVSTDGRHAVVAYGVSIDDDLDRRDFTINALAYHPVRHEIRDPHSGARDIEAGIVRAVGSPDRRFGEDFLRILRMLRFAARFDFRIDPPTWQAALAAAPGLRGLSAERVREEWYKGLGSVEEPKRLVGLWRESGAAAAWLPELVEGYPLGTPLPKPHDPVVLTAALCTDPAGVLKRLKASNEEIGRVRAMTAHPQAAVSAERVREEWYKGLGGVEEPKRLVGLWRESGAAAAWLPELVEEYPLGTPLPKPHDPVVLTAALCTDPAGVLKRLKASNEEIGRARAMTAHPQAPESAEPKVARRWLSRVGDAADDLLLLARYREGQPPGWAATVRGIRERGEAISRGQLALTGDDLRAAGIGTGPQMGKYLERLLDAVLDEPARNTRDVLLALLRQWQ